MYKVLKKATEHYIHSAKYDVAMLTGCNHLTHTSVGCIVQGPAWCEVLESDKINHSHNNKKFCCIKLKNIFYHFIYN